MFSQTLKYIRSGQNSMRTCKKQVPGKEIKGTRRCSGNVYKSGRHVSSKQSEKRGFIEQFKRVVSHLKPPWEKSSSRFISNASIDPSYPRLQTASKRSSLSANTQLAYLNQSPHSADKTKESKNRSKASFKNALQYSKINIFEISEKNWVSFHLKKMNFVYHTM